MKNSNEFQNDNCCPGLMDCCIEEVGFTVQRLVRVLQLFERDQITSFGFTPTQCYVLLELKKRGDLTMNRLSEVMNLNTSTMTRIINNLVRDGFVERKKGEEDRRIVFVGLSDKGIETSVKLEDSITNYYRKIIENLPKGRVEEVLSSVSLLLDAFDKANPNCC